MEMLFYVNVLGDTVSIEQLGIHVCDIAGASEGLAEMIDCTIKQFEMGAKLLHRMEAMRAVAAHISCMAGDNLIPDNLIPDSGVTENDYAGCGDVVRRGCRGTPLDIDPSVSAGPAGKSKGGEVHDGRITSIMAESQSGPLLFFANDDEPISLGTLHFLIDEIKYAVQAVQTVIDQLDHDHDHEEDAIPAMVGRLTLDHAYNCLMAIQPEKDADGREFWIRDNKISYVSPQERHAALMKTTKTQKVKGCAKTDRP